MKDRQDNQVKKKNYSRYQDKSYDRTNRNERRRSTRVLSLSNLVLALIGTLMIFCLAVTAVLYLRQIYYLDIRFLNLSEQTGLSETLIRNNYDTLIDYNLVQRQIRTLVFPDFPMSEAGRIHFEEVRRIFYGIQYTGAACLVLFLLIFIRKQYRRDYGCLKLMAGLSIVIPVSLGGLIALDWEAFFIRFHTMFFQNDYWLFDPWTDPVIDILPDAFFLHCAAAVLFFVLLQSMLCRLLYRFLTAGHGHKR